jgi:hypothetical protein
VLVFVATFVGAVTLHTVWDSIGTVIVYVLLAVASVGWLLLEIRRYRAFGQDTAAALSAPAIHRP